MLLSFLLMALLGGISLVVGHGLLFQNNRLQFFHCRGDRVILSIWIGILVLANCFLLLSLSGPLSPSRGIAATVVLLTVALWSHENRRSLGHLVRCEWGTLAGVAVLALGVAAYCSQVIVWYDSSLYHLQAIKWLSEYGLVPGLALIHNRLGFISSWFTLPAAFNHGLLQGRVAAVPGALCLLLLLTHGILASARLARRQGHSHDLFLAASSVLTAAVVLFWGLPNSSSPDFPVIVLAPLVAWAMLVVADRAGGQDPGAETAHAGLVPLLLAAGATSIKISALPLLLAAGCFYLSRGGAGIRKIVSAGGLIAMALVPVALAGLVTSGCAFYPVPYLCADLPWSLGSAAADSMSTLIRETARWGGPAPAHATAWNWILPWLRLEPICAALLFLALLAFLVLVRPRVDSTLRQRGYVIALGISGLVLMMYSAPTWRFGAGYLVIFPALLVAERGVRPLPVASTRTRRLFGFFPAAVIAGAAVAFHVHVIPRPSYNLLDQAVASGLVAGDAPAHFNLLLPPRPWQLRYEVDENTGKTVPFADIVVQDRCGDILYCRPADPGKSDTCWDAPLPCSPGVLKGVGYRFAAAGNERGFEKVPAR